MNTPKTPSRFNIITILKKHHAFGFVLGILDVLAIVVAFQVSYMINIDAKGCFFNNKTVLYIFLGTLLPWLGILYFVKVTEIPRSKKYRVIFMEYLQSGLIMILIFICVYFIFKLNHISRLFLLQVSVFGSILLFLIKIMEYKALKNYRVKGGDHVNLVLIVDESSENFIDNLLMHNEWGCKITTLISHSEHIRNKYKNIVDIVQENYDKILYDLIEKDTVDEVIYFKEKINSAEIRQIIQSCEEIGLVFRMKYDKATSILTNAIHSFLYDEKFLTFLNIPHNRYALAIKRLIDFSVSLVMIIILSPVFVVIAIMIKSTSPGPVIFKQERVGCRGRLFQLYKFRTMVVNAEELLAQLMSENEADGPAFKIKKDPRITGIGAFLRKTGLDELPQLFNILKNEMSLIGPRPPLPSEIRQYERWQLRRLSIKPGLSCFWQVQPHRNDIKFDKWMELDLAYIDNWSLRLDLVILIKTLKTVINKTGE